MNISKLIWILALVSFSSTLNAQNDFPLDEIAFDNPGNLKMRIHYPSKDSVPLPLVVVLHGCGQTAESVAELTGWNQMADFYGFVVLYPQQKWTNNTSLCFNWFQKEDISKNMGEAASIYHMIRALIAKQSVDSQRVYITGLSAGAAMGIALLADYPNLFQAGAFFAGGAYGIAQNPGEAFKTLQGKRSPEVSELLEFVRSQNPNYKYQYPKISIWHGKKDHIVNPKNATIILQQWAAIHQIDTIADIQISNFKDIGGIQYSGYNNSQNQTQIKLYLIDHLGHQILIAPGEQSFKGGKTGIFGVDRGFHSTFQVAQDFGLVPVSP